MAVVAVDDGPMSFPDDVPTLTDGVVTLRAHRLSDVDEMHAQCVDPDSIEWTTVPAPYLREHAVSFVVDTVPAGWHTNRDLGFAIEAEHPDGQRKFSGSISLRPMDDRVAEIAFGVHPAVRGQGVCSRAMKLILDWGFDQRGFEVVVWYAYVGNWASWRAVWANGFSFDGTVSRFLSQRGTRRDAWVGSLRAGDDREHKHEWHVPPVLESDRLRLRQLRDDDATRLEEVLTDERTRYFVGTSPVARTDGHTFVLRQLECDAKGERVNWCIADRATDEFLGHIQLFNFAGLDDTAAELGYLVHPAVRGKGVLTEALAIVSEWAFRPKEDGGFGKRRLCLGTAATNKASRHAAEKAGFTHVASLPDTFPTADGFVDETIYHRVNQL